MTAPVYLVTDLHAESMAVATLGLQCDLPDSVVVATSSTSPRSLCAGPSAT